MAWFDDGDILFINLEEVEAIQFNKEDAEGFKTALFLMKSGNWYRARVSQGDFERLKKSIPFRTEG